MYKKKKVNKVNQGINYIGDVVNEDLRKKYNGYLSNIDFSQLLRRCCMIDTIRPISTTRFKLC